MSKKLTVFLLFFILLSSFFSLNPASVQASTINVNLDSYPLNFDVEPRIVGTRTMVPFRLLAESIGIDVVWNASTKSIYAKGNGKDVTLTLNSNQVLVNGSSVPLDTPAFIDGNRTLM